MSHFHAVDIDGQLPDAMAGNQQVQGSISCRADLELLRLDAKAVPGEPRIRFEALLDKRLVQRDGGPSGVVESRIGPARIVAHLEAPGPIELNHSVHGGGSDVCGGRRRGYGWSLLS